jgi:hypothetical protein
MQRHKFELATQWERRIEICEPRNIRRSEFYFVSKTLLRITNVAFTTCCIPLCSLKYEVCNKAQILLLID